MKSLLFERPIDCEEIEHISTILQRYLDLKGLPANDVTPKPKVTRLSQLKLAYNFENLVDIPIEPALADAQC